MTPSPSQPIASVSLDLPHQVASSVWMSVATLPFVAGVLGSQALANSLQAVGLLSEEIFRGDRLPLLDLSQPTAASAEPEDAV